MDVLLLNSDIYYCKQLMNSISLLNKNTRITHIANNLDDVYRYDTPLILSDYEFHNGTLESLCTKSKIIYLSDNNEPDTICKTNIDLICKVLNETAEEFTQSKIKKAIYGELAFLGYDLSLFGTTCTYHAIKTLYDSGEPYYDKDLANLIYPKVGKLLGINAKAVKSNINYATVRMYENSSHRKIMNYFSFKNDHKPGEKKVIHQVLKHITSK